MEKEKKIKMIQVAIAVLIPGGVVGLGVWWYLTKCNHTFGFPITTKESRITYVVCTKCGKEFAYDFHHMKLGKELPNDWHRIIASGCGTSGVGNTLEKAEKRCPEGHPDSRPAPTAKDTDS